MEIVLSHLRNSIAVFLMLLVIGLTALVPVCAVDCGAEAKATCCEDGGAKDCGRPTDSASSADQCGHSVVMAVERVEQPAVGSVPVFMAAPMGVELAQAHVSTAGVTVRETDLPPPRWFDPLLVSLRV